MTKTYSYTILIHPEPETGGYWVEVPALPGCNTQGDTVEEAIAMARDAIALYLQVLQEDGKSVPEEPKHHQALVIDVAA